MKEFTREEYKTISDHHEKMMDMITDDIMGKVKPRYNLPIKDKKKEPCQYCNDSGLRPVANLQDDYDMDQCECKQS